MSLVTDRPADFDAKVMAHHAALKSRAWRITKNKSVANDLVTDTVILALKRWRSYRDGPTMWPWLCLTMKECARDNWAKMQRAVKTTNNDVAFMSARTQPNQYYALVLKDTLRSLDDIKHGDTLIAHSLGHGSGFLAKKNGISQQAIINRFGKARARLKDLA